MNTRLVWLSDSPRDSYASLLLGPGGELLARETLHVLPEADIPRIGPATAERIWAIVPGTGIRVLWLPMSVRNPVQAQAAARLLAADELAEPVDRLHIAIGTDGLAPERLVTVTAPERMHGWLGQMRSLGLNADGMIPDCLALPAPAAGTLIADWEGDWLVRASRLAFRATADLGRHLVDAESSHFLHGSESVEAAMREGISTPAVNLLQYDFAPSSIAPGDPSRRLLLRLLALLLLSPVALLLVDALRYQRAAERLQQSDAARIDRALPGRPDSLNAQVWLRQVSRQQRQSRGLSATLSRISAAVMAVPGSHVQAMHADEDGLVTTTVLHPDDTALKTILAQLQSAGRDVHAEATRPDGGMLRTEIVLVPEVSQ